MVPGGTFRSAKPFQRKRFAVGARVRIVMPGLNGVVIQADEEPSTLGEYLHTVEYTKRNGERATTRQTGGSLELVPEPVTNRSQQAPRFGNTTIHQYGVASRAYVGSEDHSVNFATPDISEVFRELRGQVAALGAETPERDNILARLEALEAAQNDPSWVERYSELLAIASNHVTVYGWLLGPLLHRLIENLRAIS